MSESGRACLADFGLSRVSGPASLTSVVTGTTKHTGTIRWLAPELLSLEDGADPKTTRMSDIYSYGCSCYEVGMIHVERNVTQAYLSIQISQVMTGNVPFFQTRNTFSIPTLVLAGSRPPRPDPTDPAHHNYGLSDAIWSLIERCWAQDALLRPTASQLEKSDLFASLADPRPVQQWGHASAAEFRRLVVPPSSPRP